MTTLLSLIEYLNYDVALEPDDTVTINFDSEELELIRKGLQLLFFSTPLPSHGKERDQVIAAYSAVSPTPSDAAKPGTVG